MVSVLHGPEEYWCAAGEMVYTAHFACSGVAGSSKWDKLIIHLMMSLSSSHCVEAYELMKMILWDVPKIMMNKRTPVTLKIINSQDKILILTIKKPNARLITG